MTFFCPVIINKAVTVGQIYVREEELCGAWPYVVESTSGKTETPRNGI